MATITEQQVLEALQVIIDPDLQRDIVSLGFVKDIKIEDGHVRVKIELTTPACPVRDMFKQQATQAVSVIPGVRNVTVEMTSQVRSRPETPEQLLPGVKQVVAIASGKGGVGKSTVAVNLAVALAKTGAKVGLLDADVYGPTVPKLMGCADEHPIAEDGKLIPIETFGIKMMSLGMLITEDSAVLWRGPMVASAVQQLLSDVKWGELDYLLVDLPPGTGDAPMTLGQSVPLAGVVIVLTPQDVAATIAAKSIQLFQRLDAPILGIVENMAGFVCSHCGEVTQIFSGQSGPELAKRFKIPFLGSIPLDPNISASGDQGTPAIEAYPDSTQAKAFTEITGKLAQQISIMATVQKDLIRNVPLIKR